MLLDTLLLIFGLLAAIVFLADLATRSKVPYAIVLLLGGILLSIIPAIPDFRLDPQIILLLFLPPLIFSAAWVTSWREFRANLVPILLLALGLVLVTVLFVALIAHLVIPGISWPVAFLLGAVVSPTDAVAAGSIIRSRGLSARVTAIIEGESLVNDATALVAYNFAVMAVATGTFSPLQASMQFVFVAAGGLLLGLALAWPVTWLHQRLSDPPNEITFGLLVPFVVYWMADFIGVSGVLATLATGIYLGRKSASFFSSTTRLQASAVWNVIVFLFNGFVFLLVGLQLVPLWRDIHQAFPLLSLLWYILAISGAVMLIRLAWIFAVIAFLHLLHSRWQVSWRNSLVVGWTGMRGGVSLATALAIPVAIHVSTPFPSRDLIIFLTFGTILVTLLLQGLTLGLLINWLGLETDVTQKHEFQLARQAATYAVLARLDELAQEEWVPQEMLQRLKSFYTGLQQREQKIGDLQEDALRERLTPYQHLTQEIITVKRMTIIQMRNEGKISDAVLRELEHDFDLEEERMN